MSGIATREIVASDLTANQLQQVADLMTACDRELDPNDLATTVEWAKSELHSGTELRRSRRLIASADDRIVGLANIELREDDANRHLIDVNVVVLPEHRRRGIGTALVRRATDMALELDRPSIVPWGVRSPETNGFWDSFGVPEKQIEQMNRLRIEDVDRELMRRWQADSSARANGYTIHSWEGPCPEPLLSAFAGAYRGMYDAPMDGLDMQFPPVTEESVRLDEASHRERGIVEKVVLALDPSGAPAAMTEIALLRHRDWFAWQQGTTTLASHRNQGLGRWVKAEMILSVLDEHPELKILETGNADSNAPMLSINTEMGFRQHCELTARQGPVADVISALDARDAARG